MLMERIRAMQSYFEERTGREPEEVKMTEAQLKTLCREVEGYLVAAQVPIGEQACETVFGINIKTVIQGKEGIILS